MFLGLLHLSISLLLYMFLHFITFMHVAKTCIKVMKLKDKVETQKISVGIILSTIHLSACFFFDYHAPAHTSSEPLMFSSFASNPLPPFLRATLKCVASSMQHIEGFVLERALVYKCTICC